MAGHVAIRDIFSRSATASACFSLLWKIKAADLYIWELSSDFT
jgi:hypothetical protein